MRRAANFELALRPANDGDFDWMLELRRVTMNPHIEAMGKRPIEEINHDAVLTDYDCAQVISIGDEDVGMVKLVTRNSPWHLRQIQIVPRLQGQGIGGIVLADILDRARTASTPVVLNVLKVNPAKRLYERYGFEVVDESEQAFKMEWRITCS